MTPIHGGRTDAATRIGIVGAGPAGSATALELIRAGVDPGDITLYDKAEFPRPKLCGGGITYRGTLAVRRLLGGPVPYAAVAEGLSFVWRGRELKVREPGPPWLVDRSQFDADLLTRAQNAGVRVRTGAAVSDVEPNRDGWTLHVGQARIAHRWLVGADGAGGVVRRRAGFAPQPTGRLVEAVYEATGPMAIDPTRLWFHFDPLDDSIGGYAWIFPYPRPDGAPVFKLGIMDGRGDAPGPRLRAWVESYAARHGFRRIEAKIPGWPERYYTPAARAHVPGLVLVGEAWGIDPLLGEGITPALEQARYAAGRIAAALHTGRSTIGGFEAGFLRSEPGWNLFFQAVLARGLYYGDSQRWMHVLFTSHGLKALAASGRAAYGRLGRMPWRLTAYFLAGWLRTRTTSTLPPPGDQPAIHR